MMNKPKKILIGTAIVIGLLLIVPFLIPMQTYLLQVEKLATEKLGQPVTIGSVHLMLLPSPRVVAGDIVVGKRDELKVAQLVVIPTIGSLFSDTKTLDLSISKPIIKKAALEFVSALTAKKSDDSAPSSIHIRHIKIDELQFANYPVMNAEATLSADNKPESAILETLDGKLKADVTPNGDEQLIVVTANKWTLPTGLPLLIDKAKLEMQLKGNKLEIPSIDIALYGGKLTGNAVLNWQKSWRLNGKLNIANLAVQQPSRMVSKTVYLSGNLFGNGNFSAKAKEAGRLADNLRADFNFKVNNGVLHGLDLVKVASLLLKQSQGGGETQFDAFSGLLNVSGKQYHLRNLKISSGLLTATGQVKVKANQQLDGAVVADVKNSVGLAAIPLDVSGTVSNPVVLPNKAAVAGAIAGTAILGPGVGTSVGVKAAGAVEKLKGLFGGN
jgi:uncharacterized protein involved in outer membrane biogenesis